MCWSELHFPNFVSFFRNSMKVHYFYGVCCLYTYVKCPYDRPFFAHVCLLFPPPAAGTTPKQMAANSYTYKTLCMIMLVMKHNIGLDGFSDPVSYLRGKGSNTARRPPILPENFNTFQSSQTTSEID